MQKSLTQIAHIGRVLLVLMVIGMVIVNLVPVAGNWKVVGLAAVAVFAASAVASYLSLLPRFAGHIVSRILVATFARTVVAALSAFVIAVQIERPLVVAFLIWVSIFYMVALRIETQRLLVEVRDKPPESSRK